MMVIRLILSIGILLALPLSAYAQSLWKTLRPFATKTVEVADSIFPSGDTLFLRLEVPDSTRRAPFLSADSLSRPLNTSSFILCYRPLKLHLDFKSQYTPEARRDSFLLAKDHPLGGVIDLSDHSGLSPLDRARLDYMMANPASVMHTWQELPDPTKDVREGRKLHNQESDHKELAKLFRPDDDLISGKLAEAPKEKESPWKLFGEENLQFSQLYVNNWIKGGENSAALLHDFRCKAIFEKGRSQWESSFTSKLGLTYTSTLRGRVSDDLFDLSSKYGFKAVNKWYYSFLGTFKTQLFRNYSSSDIEKENPKSKLLSPAYVQLIFGMDYKRENLSILLSPYTGIITLVADTAMIDQTSYGISENKKANFVNGFSITANWKKTIIYGIYYTTKLELFYEYFRKDGNKRFDWENIIDVQINRFLSTRFLVELRYFDNESDHFQVKENFSIAFKYSF